MQLTRHSFDPMPTCNGKHIWRRGGEHASAFRSTEVGRRRGVERNVEVASGACCSGGGGMEVGKEQQAGARRKRAALYRFHCGQSSPVSTNWQRRITRPTTDNWNTAHFVVSVNTTTCSSEYI